MCGISGIYSKTSHLTDQDLKSVDRMNSLQSHRGPDDHGIYQAENCILGHRRLAIIDLSKDGKQPFLSRDNRFSLVFNGEIYNYLELRIELEEIGIEIKTKTDTEVLLLSYIQWGYDAFDKLNGMFAFAIYDNLKSELVLCRDRFGIKPLYYHLNDEKIYFSSEILPLISIIPNFIRKPNDQMIYDYLLYNRTNHTNETFFININKLEHGHYLILNSTGCKKINWYELRKNKNKSFEDENQLLQYLSDSIALKMRSDVEIGTSLSGGVDSSGIVGILSKKFNIRNLRTYSAVYKTNHRSNEKNEIESFNKYNLNMEYIHPDSSELFKELNLFISMLNEPVPDTSIYAGFKVYERASDHVKVMLDGQGADESLAGYMYFRGYYYKDLIKNFKIVKFFVKLKEEIFLTKSTEGLLSLFFFSLPSRLKDFALRLKVTYLGDKLKHFKSSKIISNALWASKNLTDSIYSHFEFKLEHILTWGDKISMAHSVEVRYPFLDHRFVERAIGIDPDQLFDNGFNKAILRKALIGLVPNQILKKRQKVGYETPENEWFRQPTNVEHIKKILNSESFQKRGYINPSKAKELYEKHISNKINISGDIWKWINLELWFRIFIDPLESKFEKY